LKGSEEVLQKGGLPAAALRTSGRLGGWVGGWVESLMCAA